MRDLSAARKYARSLFSDAQQKNQVLACQQGLQEVLRIVRVRPSVGEILVHPTVSQEQKSGVIHSILGEYATPLLERFLALLVENHRFALLESIVEAFQEEVDRSQNVQALTVRTAFAMSDKQQQDLKAKLEAWLHSKVRMDVQVDPQLIGGLVIRTRDFVVDQSLQGQLSQLQEQLSQ